MEECGVKRGVVLCWLFAFWEVFRWEWLFLPREKEMYLYDSGINPIEQKLDVVGEGELL